jgi:hypothetical protein
LLEEKKASLNKARTQRSVDISEFANLKALTKAEEEDDNPLGVRAHWTRAGRITGAPAQCVQQWCDCEDADCPGCMYQRAYVVDDAELLAAGIP